jgi:hypothetical protein
MANRWQKDADGILIFVSPLRWGGCSIQRKYCRPVYSLLRSQHWLRSLSKTSGQIHKIPPHSISRTSINFLQIQTYLVNLSLPLQLNHPLSLRRDQQSWSTHSGSSVWSSVSHVPYWRLCYSSGRVDTWKLRNRHGTAHTSERRSVHSLLMGWTSFIFRGRLKHCPLCFTCLCSCSSQDWSFFCSTLTTLYSVWLFGGLDLQERYTDASR